MSNQSDGIGNGQLRAAAGAAAAKERLSRDIHQLALAFKASGGAREVFEQQVKAQLDEVFSEKE